MNVKHYTKSIACYLVGFFAVLPSVLWRCWLGGRKGIRPVKNWVVGCCMVICLERGADLHVAQLMPLPLTVSFFSKIQFGFTFLIPAHPGSPGKRAIKRLCVCVRACARVCVCARVRACVRVCVVFCSCYSAPSREAQYCDDWWACLSVCLLSASNLQNYKSGLH